VVLDGGKVGDASIEIIHHPAAVDIAAESRVLRRMQWIAVDKECGLAVVERERRREVARNEAATAARLYRCDQGDEITVLAERQQRGAAAAEGSGLAEQGDRERLVQGKSG